MWRLNLEVEKKSRKIITKISERYIVRVTMR